MNKKYRVFLEANGLRAGATDQEAWALYDQLVADGVEMPGIDPGQRSAAGGTPAGLGQTPAAPPTPSQNREEAPASPDLDAAVARALVVDAQRRSDIDDRLRVAGLADADNGDFARSLLNDPQMSLERASKAIFARMKTQSKPFGNGAFGAEVGLEAGQKLRAAVTDGLLLRSGHRLEKPSEGSREFRGRSMVEICRELLTAAGISTRGLSNRDIAGRALASGSTSDFPAIFSALVNKNLLKAYMEWPQTWRLFVAIASANDFKAIHAIRLSGSPDLKGMNENGEYQTASFSDASENYRVISKGIKIPLTREMIINDDLRAFTRIPQLFGAAAKRMEGDAVYSLITANGNMSDGVPLFHATHNNLAGTPAVLSSDSLSAGRSSMRTQKGMAGESIDVIPAFLLTPTTMETDADVLLRSASLPEATMSSGVVNPWAGKLTPVSDPHLDAADANAWYMLGHPNQAPVIEAAWLEGEEQPYVEEMVDFNSDALITKVRHDFGAGAVDFVGAYKNAGA
ncbi:MAG: hypothetical protein PHZ02_07245 [Desulfocapsaceae bacterium]|nr:hypothetical protein [Desulfocapsaceae bacterium]